MAIINPAKLYPKPANGEKILIKPILLQKATKYWDGRRRIIELSWESHRQDLQDRQQIYQIYAWNMTHNMPAIIDLPKSCLDNYNIVNRKAAGGTIVFTRIERQGKLITHFENVDEVQA